MSKLKSKQEVITDKCNGKKKSKARDAKEYDMMLISFIESEIKGESK